MNNDNYQATKPTYQEALRERVRRFMEADDVGGMPVRDEDVDALYVFVKGIALESFKNGKEAGQRQKNAPQMRSAQETGRARPAK